MVSLKTSRRNRQIRAVVNAIKALALHQAETVLVATISRCADDLAERNTAQASRLSPEELALFAAYKAATLAPSRRLIQAAPGITAEETADLCARLQNAAERVAARQGRRAVLDGFKALDASPHPDQA